MFKKEKKLIKQNMALESKEDLDPESARLASLAARSYIDAARFFESFIAAEFQKKEKMWKRLSLFFGILAFMSVAAVLSLTPLKSVEPFVLRVDNASGYTDIVRPGLATTTEQRDDEYWSTSYIIARESYNFSTQDLRYGMVESMSYSDTFSEYKNFQLSKKGYMAVLGNSRQVRVEINNVPIINRSPDSASGTIQIRFTKFILDSKGEPVDEIHPTKWLATMSYDYKHPVTTKGDEWKNPRGFGVVSYSLTQEVGD